MDGRRSGPGHASRIAGVDRRRRPAMNCESAWRGRCQFGTAGLRGVVAAGSNRMNRAVVIRATRGVADYLLAQEASVRPVVVGGDARPSSRQFMEDTVGVLAAAGIPVRYFEEPTPTPIVAYAGLRSGAQAAIVITASHKPPADNGYKVYASNGAQIVPPTDTENWCRHRSRWPRKECGPVFGHPQ